MDVEITKEGTERVMRLIPTDDDESRDFGRFCRPWDKLTVTMRKDTAWRDPHLEVRKEIL